MTEKQSEELYNNYKIEIHYQPTTGDNVKVFFRVWKDIKPIFSLWEQISRTSMRNITREEALDFLKEKGLALIKKMIDLKSFKRGKEYKFWERK